MPAGWRVGGIWPFAPKVEDPIRIKEFSDALVALRWVGANRRDALCQIFECVSRLAQAEVRYYFSRRKKSGFIASWFRFLSWMFGSAGILVPLIYPLISEATEKFLSAGYLLVAIGGVFLVADKVFNGSEGHARYVTAQLRVEHAFAVFAIEWQALFKKFDEGPLTEDTTALFQLAVKFIENLYGALGNETAEWKTATDAAIQELNRKAGIAPTVSQ